MRDDLRSSLLSEKIFAKVGDNVKVTEAEIKAYYDSNPQLYTQKASRDVRHILVTSKALADDLHGQVKNGGDFAALAKKYSTDPGSKQDRRQAHGPAWPDGPAVRQGRLRVERR